MSIASRWPCAPQFVMPRQAVFFLIDTQGTNCVGCYSGNPDLKTPNIDRLAADGVRFDHAYTCSPVCGPARSAIMTGLYPHATGVLGNDQAPHSDRQCLRFHIHSGRTGG
ncbi:sulfatase-like hydrolase/transferase [Opitutaceae bacterium]|nr:sulfatase-like hydrolase/transferase [Opitutaceae bacterium]